MVLWLRKSQTSPALCPSATICPTRNAVSDYQKTFTRLRMCPGVKKLSNEEVYWLTITQSAFQLSNVVVQKNCSSPTNCPRVLLLSFCLQFDSKNLFQSKSSLVSWTSLRVAHNVGACDGRGLGGLSNAAKRNAKADQL